MGQIPSGQLNNVMQPVYVNGTAYGLDEYSGVFNSRPMVFQVEPERALDFSLPDINNIVRGEVARVWLTFEFLPIAKYRQLLKDLRKPEFPLEYYDIETDMAHSGMYYCTPFDEFEPYVANIGGVTKIVGVLNLKFELIATNNQVGIISVSFLPNGGVGVINPITGYFGETVQLPSGDGLSRNGYQFNGWLDIATGVTYKSEEIITLTTSMTLYASWIATTLRTLSFSYSGATYIEGIGLSESNFIASKEVHLGSAVGTLPSPRYFIKPFDDLEEYVEVYSFYGWYDLPYDNVINNGVHNGKNFSASTIYSVDGNETIYAHWTPHTYTLDFELNGGTFPDNSARSVTTGYGMAITRPTNPTKAGYSFGGWYKDAEFKMQYTSWAMPYGANTNNLPSGSRGKSTIYAKWVQQ